MRHLLMTLFCVVAGYCHAQQNQYVFVFLNHKTDSEKLSKEETDKIMKGHMENIARLAQEGKLIAAGPFEGGGGIFVLNTKSVEEGSGWLNTDPGVQAKRWNVEILPFTVRAGGICPAKQPYEMVAYNFVRFKAVVTKSTAPDYPEIFAKHHDYLKQIKATGNVLLDGVFGDYDGGITIIRGDLQQAVIEHDPGVQEGLFSLDIKTLWIAKGSFCEQ
jgi:uncharacterized protein YciI